jgi:hypothetical protein
MIFTGGLLKTPPVETLLSVAVFFSNHPTFPRMASLNIGAD